MFEFLTQSTTDAINLIKKDHETVKGLFDKFEKAESLREKRKIVADTIMELKLHAAIEEEIFYAVVRPQIEKKIMNEADEEHHVVKLLIAELEEMDGTEDHYDAKYKVLSENVRHHIKEEESDMLSKARVLHIDYEVMGADILARKEQLKKTGIPVFAEEKMVSNFHNKGDSPAKAAKTTKPAPKSSKSAKSKISTSSLLPKVVKLSAARSLKKKTKTAIKKSAKGLSTAKKLAAHTKAAMLVKKRAVLAQSRKKTATKRA